MDTIRLRGRVADAECIDRLSHRQITRLVDEGDKLVAGIDTLHSGARVGVDLKHGGAPEAWVEFSAPKIANGDNVVPLPLREAVAVGREVYEEASALVDWVDDFDNLRVLRLDVDNDFQEVPQQDALLGALARVRAPYSPKTRLFPDASKNGATTLTRGPASRWLATLYSKEGEALHRARYAEDKAAAAREVERAKGRLRYEARLRPEAMGRHLRLVRDLEADALSGLARSYFDRVGYGLEVSGMQRVVATVMAADTMRTNTKLALIGWLFLEAQGIPAEQHRNRRADYARRARELGVGAAELLELAVSESVRLDYEARRAVAA